ncbi:MULTISPECIES: DUF6510 family protein [unclassified Streptomyces]|uniref:DUF6510 family protein n=1 Tax=unclassified Streptomyces TaxID=2593676 RepID=UPI002441B804|nr:DUF6510 family protein [Streptomyces sp. DH41]MDG9727011.1 DUF6510 family protein [Streptomyces sp. DH41]
MALVAGLFEAGDDAGPVPGLTGRCPGCADIALRAVSRPGHLWLRLGTGGGAFRFALPPSAP